MMITVSLIHHRPAGSSKRRKRNLSIEQWLALSPKRALELLADLAEDAGAPSVAKKEEGDFAFA